MSELRTVLVAGGTGFIGSHLCKFLKNKGYGVQVVSRMPGQSHITWNQLSLKGLPDNIHAVVNVSGQNVLDMTQRWTHSFKQNIYNSRIKTNETLVKAISTARNKPETFISISGVGIYKPSPKIEYDESSQIKPYDFLSEMCVDWEKSAASAKDNCRQVNVRCGVVLGKDGGMVKQLYLPFFLGLGGPILPGSQYLPWIHLKDLCKLFLFCLENKNVDGVINGVAPQAISSSKFSQTFAKTMNRPHIFPVPKFALNILLGKDRANMLTTGQKVIPKKAVEMGFIYDYPNIELACKEILHQKR